MKKMLLLLVALVAFAACDDDPIDYSTWSNEELLATPGGVDYLIRTAAPIDYAAIEEELETKVADRYHYFIHDWLGWTESSKMNGAALLSYVIIEDVIRCCVIEDLLFRTPEGDETSCYYRDKKFTGDRLSALLAELDCGRGAKLKARIENTLVVESYGEDNSRMLDLIRLVDGREEWLERYPYNFYELKPWGGSDLTFGEMQQTN